MTRVEFFDLAQRISVYARTHPRRYKVKVTLLALLGYGVIFGMIALCVAILVLGGSCFTQSWFWETAGRNARLVVLFTAVLFSTAATLFGLVRSLFVRIAPPAGRRVQREDAPGLFAMIDEVVAASQAPPPHTVLLTWDFNAAVSQQPRFGWLGPTRDFVILGVPLMAAMTPEQFKAVLAHEFGHLRGGHARFKNWIYRLRMVWDQTLERLARKRQRVAMFVAKFLRWYAPQFSAYTALHNG